jgi:cytochrome c oxidase cbb3-type subunit 3
MSRIRVLLLGGLVFLAGCQREERDFRPVPPFAALPQTISMSSNRPGQPAPPAPSKNPYGSEAYTVSQGQKLYQAFNCNGCHFNGGGGIGPPLMDDTWIYGGEPANIVASILEGRPNGMPSFRGLIPETQVWQIAAYVRSLSGQLPKDVAPQRPDHMLANQPPATVTREEPKPGGDVPAGSLAPTGGGAQAPQ